MRCLVYISLLSLLVIITKFNYPSPNAHSTTLENIDSIYLNRKPTAGGVHFLLPFTKWVHIQPCGTVFDEQIEFNKSIECVKDKQFNKLEAKIPRCFIITVNSPDVYKNLNINYISLGFLSSWKILGLYEPKDRSIFIVDNPRDVEVDTYQHELIHYFLDLEEGDGDSQHTHSLWDKCGIEKKYSSKN